MGTPGVINGTAVKIAIQGKNVAYCTNASLSLNSDTIDITTKDSSGWAQFMGGLNSWDVSGDAYFTQASGTDERAAAYVVNTMISKSVITVALYTSPFQSGDLYFSGSGIFTSVEISGGVEEAASFSFGIKGVGALSMINQSASGTLPPSGGIGIG